MSHFLTSPPALPRPTGAWSVGSYTLMMDWAQCKDYCAYFPHAPELDHIYSFADILEFVFAKKNPKILLHICLYFNEEY